MSRAGFVLCVVGLVVTLFSSARAVTNPITQGPLTIKLQSIATINTATDHEPLDMTPAGDGTNRLFVATHGGKVRLIKDGTLQPTAFLDVAAHGITLVGGSGADERGLLGIAFHPNFNAPVGTPGRGKFYTFTSENPGGNNADFFNEFELGATAPVNGYQNLVREWTATPGTGDVADATASRVLFRIAKYSQTNHNGGGLRFDHNGLLYISVGDSGGGNDFEGSSGPTNNTDGHTNTTGNGQDLANVYGKILRIDPLGTNGKTAQFGIPASNPFAGNANADTKVIYAYGMRNPFRFSFDKNDDTKMYVGDVGQGVREEIDLVDAAINAGGNFGWPYLEGTLDNSNYPQTGAGTIAPIGEYVHPDGTAIQGGFVYRGSLIPTMTGKYVFGDLGKSGTGRLFYMDAAGGTINEFTLGSGSAAISGTLDSMGQDANGELYALMANGTIFALVPEPASLSLLVLTGLFMQRRMRRH